MSKTDKTLFESPYSRHFTHLTIPAEIWLRKDISLQAKCLWAEIASLYCPEAGGCYASDEYLCEFMQVKRSRLHEVMKELKDKSLLEVVKNDGRRCIRKAILGLEVQNRAQQISGKPDIENPRYPESRNPDVRDPGLPTYIYKKEDNKEEIYAPPSGDAKKSSSCPPLSAKDPKKEIKAPNVSVTPEEHKKLVEAFGDPLVKKGYEELSEWKKSAKPSQVNKHSSDYYRLRKWVIPDLQEKKTKKYGGSNASVKQDIRDKQMERWIDANGNPDDNPNILRFDD